jgi:hypothetical protein
MIRLIIQSNLSLTSLVEAAENFAGFSLAIGSMVGNYVLCFPFVVARHRQQTVPRLFSRQRDTPLETIRYLADIRRREGWRGLYPGFGLGLIAQGFAVTYETVLNMALARILSKVADTTSLMAQFTLAALTKSLELAVYIPLHPIYRNALILRTQMNSPIARRVITSYTGFWQACRRDLYRFSPFGLHTYTNSLPLASVFVPSCLLSIISEKLLTIVYKYLHRFISKSKLTGKRTSSRRHHHHQRRQRTSSLRQSLSRELLTSPTSGTAATPPAEAAKETSSKDAHLKFLSEETTLYSFYPEVVCGITSSIVTRAIVYPAETVVFRLMLQGSGVLKNDTNYTGFWNCLTTVIREEGWWSGLYQGIGSWMAEVALGYVILEFSWVALRLTQWRLRRKYDRQVEMEWQARKATFRKEN